ncbi:MAG: DUF1643 domain-containing protein [Cardiobacterium sp.]|jgi:hypothetical protein
MEYKIDIYDANELKNCRFALGKSSENSLFIFGLNPSTADNNNPDQTIMKIMGFAEQNGYTGFVMLNLYPRRATQPENLDKSADKDVIIDNERVILEQVSKQKNPNILLAWGNKIYTREYFIECINRIYNLLTSKIYQINWWRIGDLTQSGQPRHPSRAPYQDFQKMDMETYFKTLNYADCNKREPRQAR